MEDPRYNIIPPKVPRCTAWPQPPRGGRCTHMYTTRYPRMSKYHAPLMKGHTHTCDAHFVKPIAPVRIVHGHVSILLCWSKLPTWSPRSVFNRCILLLVRVILLHPPWNMTDQVVAAACIITMMSHHAAATLVHLHTKRSQPFEVHHGPH